MSSRSRRASSLPRRRRDRRRRRGPPARGSRRRRRSSPVEAAACSSSGSSVSHKKVLFFSTAIGQRKESEEVLKKKRTFFSIFRFSTVRVARTNAAFHPPSSRRFPSDPSSLRSSKRIERVLEIVSLLPNRADRGRSRARGTHREGFDQALGEEALPPKKRKEKPMK